MKQLQVYILLYQWFLRRCIFTIIIVIFLSRSTDTDHTLVGSIGGTKNHIRHYNHCSDFIVMFEVKHVFA